MENLIGKKVMTSFYNSKIVANKCLAILHQNIVMLILSDLSITVLLSQVTKTELSTCSQREIALPKKKFLNTRIN